MKKPFGWLEDRREAAQKKLRGEQEAIEDADEAEQEEMTALCRAKVDAAARAASLALRVRSGPTRG